MGKHETKRPDTVSIYCSAVVEGRYKGMGSLSGEDDPAGSAESLILCENRQRTNQIGVA